jgi:hypothetical protein
MVYRKYCTLGYVAAELAALVKTLELTRASGSNRTYKEERTTI